MSDTRESAKAAARLLFYRDFEYQELFDGISGMLLLGGDGNPEAAFKYAGELVEIGVTHGFEGNLWHCFLAFCLANNENAYSRSCEIVGPVAGSLNQLVLHDFAVFKRLFDADIAALDGLDEESRGIWSCIRDYRSATGRSQVFNSRIRDRIVELSVALEGAESAESFAAIVTEFYREFGVGRFGLNKAFRIDDIESGSRAVIKPITSIEHVYLKDLVGYELQKKKLIANTEAFIQGKAANNVLLYGDSGTGKSSSIKAILNQYYDRGLRMIEVYKHQFKNLSDVLEQIKDRNYKFIIYMDDLSFEDFEIEYKYLKAIIEGGLGKKPTNVLIYATSNRRHLIREKFSDKREILDDLHANDTVQEKLSLVARFGVTIYYGSPDKKEFQNIVRVLAEKYGVHMDQEQLLLEANKWELSHGGLSGRTASQFITHLMGQD